MSATKDDEAVGRVRPARLAYLAIYNPSLALTETEEDEQILFYWSWREDHEKDENEENVGRSLSDEEKNERLRQTGLAQAMVNFAQGFSHGEPLDSIETERHRTVVKEVEKGWWIVASVDLTRIPVAEPNADGDSGYEYSSREVSSAVLLLKQLLRGHAVFLLHHTESLEDLYLRLPKKSFRAILANFWTRFAETWDVLLHGSPALETYGGIKVARGGELGIGVGEEDWGSAEREVLEGIVRNTDGLNELIVARFGQSYEVPKSASRRKPSSALKQKPWLGQENQPGPFDGVVFSGTGRISRHSLRALSYWIEALYVNGEVAYGFQTNPSSTRRRRRRKDPHSADQMPVGEESRTLEILPESIESNSADAEQKPPANIPKPVVPTHETAATRTPKPAKPLRADSSNSQADAANASADTWAKYLTLGYGTLWGSATDDKPTETGKKPEAPGQASNKETSAKNKSSTQPLESEKSGNIETLDEKPKRQTPKHYAFFPVGLQGNLDILENEEGQSDQELDESDGTRISLRTVHVEVNKLAADHQQSTKDDEPNSQSDHDSLASILSDSRMLRRAPTETCRLRVVVYAHQPFIFTLLFDQNTDSLAIPSFFRTLHSQFLALYKPLLYSTSMEKATERFQTALANSGQQEVENVYDLIYDPSTLMVQSSIPNIPPPVGPSSEGASLLSGSTRNRQTEPPWTRMEALTLHSQILGLYATTRKASSDRERTIKTSRGYWVHWVRVPPASLQKWQANSRQQSAVTSPQLEAEPASLDHAARQQEPHHHVLHHQETHQPTSTRTGYKEAILVRRANDTSGTSHRRGASGSSNSYASIMGLGSLGGSSGGGGGSSRAPPSAWSRWMGQASRDSARPGEDLDGSSQGPGGVGIDARKYIEALFSASR